ncbi:MAG: redox-sensing transcriptional repressor Rex [Anaerolineae bacterium]|nr:redox-sensing transcriptional repressor Rex [Anaerolineae bacterium]MBT3711965.1 redox-sensing transcriptional repressor Rex [Anaerolineae bacterium]MBT4310564.1 redox-sensing transcriptional repressor Rex [Anaerolineae bacterium]MBT4459874.1 redox-sensing transcriptional repressor Rex [Anaerolineae bacterium]MBT6062671.1 redox-sensing transcriptional repressor Rex [Anaerolineae bacterium]
MTNKKIPDIIIGRLPLYLRALERMTTEGAIVTSSKELGEWVGISAAQIRKDISQFGEFGKQGTGYNIDFLSKKLREIMNIDRVWDVAIIGAGDIGHGLARYQGFLDRGFRVALAFDIDPEKIGTKIGDVVVEDISKMVVSINDADVKIAMIAVPADNAQDVAEKLVKAGVKAILNYATIIINVPEDVRVQYIDPATHLQWMTYYL